MTMWPVSTWVNTPKNDDEDLIRPVRLLDEADMTAGDVTGANDPDADRKPANSE
jgi:hypothetical protein